MDVPAEMQFDLLAGAFGVVDTGDIVIKQEPQEDCMMMMLVDQPEDEVMEPNFNLDDNCDDEHQVYPHPEEIDDVILQRAVSPPTYAVSDLTIILFLSLFLSLGHMFDYYNVYVCVCMCASTYCEFCLKF